MHREVSTLLIVVLAACSGDSSSTTDTSDFGYTDSADADTDVDTDSDADTDTDTETYVPEPEDDFLLQPPAQTDEFVFVANADRNTVTRIRVASLEVVTTSVGSRPEIVLATSDYRHAVVFNEGDDTVTLLDTATLDKRTVPVRSNFNDMVLSPDGAHAVLWHNTAKDEPGETFDGGLQSFNEASFVRIATGEHFPMAVGFNPRMVRFTPDGALAVVVADAYLATVDLTAAAPQPTLIELAADDLDPPEAEEVVLTEDGAFAWVRQFGATELLFVDLGNRTLQRVPVGKNPSDLDLSVDGQQAIAVARGSDELWIFNASNPDEVRVIPTPKDAPYGALLLDPTGAKGILFTSAILTERFAVWDLATDEIRERELVKPVSTIAINPTGETMLVFHTQKDGSNTTVPFFGQWALTMVRLDDLNANPLLLPGEPLAYANGTEGQWGFFIMDGQPFLEVLDYQRLLHNEYELRSLPSFVGVLPDLSPDDSDSPAAWVSQQHELGRISFYDPDDDSLETLTGFELNSEIE